MSVLPYSYSSLTSFEACPKKHYEERIIKSVIVPKSEVSDEGVKFHKLVENYINDKTEFDHKYSSQVIKILNEISGRKIFYFPERKLCVTKDLKPCDWKDPKGYSRGIIDVLQVDNMTETAYIYDWKTGRKDIFSTQLMLNAIHIMAHYSNVKKVEATYVWLKENTTTHQIFNRHFLEQYWETFERRLGKLLLSEKNNEWSAKPSGLCKNHCGVITCEHNGRYNKHGEASQRD